MNEWPRGGWHCFGDDATVNDSLSAEIKGGKAIKEDREVQQNEKKSN